MYGETAGLCCVPVIQVCRWQPAMVAFDKLMHAR